MQEEKCYEALQIIVVCALKNGQSNHPGISSPAVRYWLYAH